MDHPFSWLRYVDASDVDDETIEFDGLKVRNEQKDKLGSVEGFVVDSQTARPYYVVVDSGGWFKSKHFLLPVGHAHIDGDNDALVVDLAKERIDRFPGFDKDRFAKMSEDEIRQFNNETCVASSATVVSYTASEPFASQWDRPQYAAPSWWTAKPSSVLGQEDEELIAGAEFPSSKVAPAADSGAKAYQAQQGTAEGRDAAARRNPDSPFFEGRAQPGDVIGLDTGGEQTHIGETAEDENKRRQSAQEAANKNKG